MSDDRPIINTAINVTAAPPAAGAASSSPSTGAADSILSSQSILQLQPRRALPDNLSITATRPSPSPSLTPDTREVSPTHSHLPATSALAHPIPQGPNSHTGAVDGTMAHLLRTESEPNLFHLDQRTQQQQISVHSSSQHHHHQLGSTSTHPLYPKRFNDDVTDHKLSPGVNNPYTRSTSNPQTPIVRGQGGWIAQPDGQTGNAPNIPAPILTQLPAPALGALGGSSASGSSASSGVSHSHSTSPSIPHHPPSLHHAATMVSMSHLNLPDHMCNHKARFDHSHAHSTVDTELAERDSHDVPIHRPMYEKDEHGIFQFAGPPIAMTPFIRAQSKANLASLNEPAATGSGPRGPPVTLVTSSLATSSVVARPSTADADGSHPHGREKLPYNRIKIEYSDYIPSTELTQIAQHIRACLELRTKFVWTPLRDEKQYDILENPVYTPPSLDTPLPPRASDIHYEMHEGVFSSWQGSSDRTEAKQIFTAPNRKEFGQAMGTIMDLVISGPVKTFAHNRLHILEARFNLHELLNHDIEQLVQKSGQLRRVASMPHRDFYNIRKIDNHVHHSAAMNQKHLLRFIKAKLKKDSDEIVIIRDGQKLTLPQVFKSLNITAYDLSVDTLDMHADKTFHRFDKFNLKYNPVGESRLREIFLKYNNFIKGKYLAELTQQVFDDLESNKYQFSEYRLSIYGAKPNEWDVLSDWVVDYKLFSCNVRWMIQIPRLYSIYKASGQVKNFQEMLYNIFHPLFEVTLDPSSHPKLHVFLQSCVGFDMVDDESLRERPFNDSLPTPDEWNYEYDPPYALFAYYLYANLCALNKLRVHRGMNSFTFRPHSGEAGDIEHLAASFLLAKGINHGLMLQKSPALQYLYYLAQIGISMSPLSNNLLFLEYEKNPFPRFFKRGLNVTLSTDDPLMIHVTREPLVEEYSVAGQVWKLSAIDMSEIARSSVLQSGFEQQFKAHYIGNSYWKRSLMGNDVRQTNVPDIRIQFRAELLGDEFRALQKHAQLPFTEELCDRII